MRTCRRKLSSQSQLHAGLKSRSILARHRWFKAAKHLAFYWPSDGELNPTPLLMLALSLGKTCYLPTINTQKKTLQFRQFKRGDRLRRNIYGIPEPTTKNDVRSIQAMDLVVMPLVAFDLKGNRLGMGGGYYDRCLAKAKARKPKRIGLAHSLQQVTQLKTNAWDIPMHAIVTEQRFISVRQTRLQ